MVTMDCGVTCAACSICGVAFSRASMGSIFAINSVTELWGCTLTIAEDSLEMEALQVVNVSVS